MVSSWTRRHFLLRILTYLSKLREPNDTAGRWLADVFFPQVTMTLSPHAVPRHVLRCRYPLIFFLFKNILPLMSFPRSHSFASLCIHYPTAHYNLHPV